MVDRDEIIRLIKYHAELNAGIPPGKETFECNYRIRESSWSGRYWARWGDALTEAGFEPRALQGKKLNDNELLSQFADFTLSLGHIPTSPELKMRRYENKEFPNAQVFANRLGKRADLLRRLFMFALDHPQYSAVINIVKPILDKSAVDIEVVSPVVPSTPGQVYLMKSDKHFKIGKTSNLDRRTREIKLVVPGKLDMVHSFETDDPEGIERYWHRRFAHKRVEGEWFLLDASDVAAFKRRGQFM